MLGNISLNDVFHSLRYYRTTFPDPYKKWELETPSERPANQARGGEYGASRRAVRAKNKLFGLNYISTFLLAEAIHMEACSILAHTTTR